MSVNTHHIHLDDIEGAKYYLFGESVHQARRVPELEGVREMSFQEASALLESRREADEKRDAEIAAETEALIENRNKQVAKAVEKYPELKGLL